jgi:hypothetical protein
VGTITVFEKNWMKFNNKKRIQNHKYIYLVTLILLVAIFLIILDVPLLNVSYQIFKYNFLVLSFLLIVHTLNGREYFEYDSTGQILIIKNASIVKHGIFPESMMAVEFPKSKLNRFKIKNYGLYKTLSLYINSKEKGIVKKSFNITNVSRKRRHNLKESLKKIISENTLKT